MATPLTGMLSTTHIGITTIYQVGIAFNAAYHLEAEACCAVALAKWMCHGPPPSPAGPPSMVTTPVTHVAGIVPAVTPTPDPHNKHTAESLLPDDANDDTTSDASKVSDTSNIFFALAPCTHHPPWPQPVPTVSPLLASTLLRGGYAYINSIIYQARS